MNRVLILVEGSTERAVVEQGLAPYFGERNLSLHAKVLGKPGHKGGIRNFDAVRREVAALLRQERGSYVSTFFDYYGLPAAWPGLDQARGGTAQDKARIVETAMATDLHSILAGLDSPGRFLPYVQMHELEALLFSDPAEMARAFGQPSLVDSFSEIVRQCGACEEIDDNPNGAPSRRIASLFPGYRKGRSLNAHAPRIIKGIGLDGVRRACPHFNSWLVRLEALESHDP